MLTTTERAISFQNMFSSAMSNNATASLKDRNFVGGDQWSDTQKAERKDRTMITLNSAPVAKRKVKALYTSEQATIRVKPYVSNSKTDDTAMVSQAILDNILATSMTDYVMDKVFDDLLTQGMGFAYVSAEYAAPDSFEQTLRLRRVKNPENVFFDLNTIAEDFSDMRHCGWTAVYDRKVLLQYGLNIDELKFAKSFPQNAKVGPGKINSESIVLCSFFEKVEVPTQLLEFVNPITGQVQTATSEEIRNSGDYAEELKKIGFYDILSARMEDESVGYSEMTYEQKCAFHDNALYSTSLKINRSRSTFTSYVKESLLSGSSELTSTLRKLKYLPLIPMLGESYRVDDDLYYDSMFRWSKQASKIHNFLNSNLIERLSMQPMANFLALDEQVDGFENDYNTANKTPRGVLKYKRLKNADGSTYTTAPKELVNETKVGNWADSLDASKLEVDNLTGLQETALGVSGKEVSADAINARASQSADTIKSFITSRHKAMALLGKILEDYIPYFLVEPFTVEKENLDGKIETIEVNGGSKYQVSTMQFSTKLDIGTDYIAQKQQANTSLLKIAEIFPDYADDLIDKIIETSDYRGASTILERIMAHQQRLISKRVADEKLEKTDTKPTEEK